jgi:hypothetical protein
MLTVSTRTGGIQEAQRAREALPCLPGSRQSHMCRLLAGTPGSIVLWHLQEKHDRSNGHASAGQTAERIETAS